MADEALGSPLQHHNMGVGITISDEDGEAVVMITMGDETPAHFVVVVPEVALQVSHSMHTLAIEAKVLQEQMKYMTLEERTEKINEIRDRYNADMN